MVQLNGQANAEQPARGGALAHIAEPLRTLAVPVDSLNLDPSNARTHPEKNLAAIKASLARFGQRQPVVVQREGMVVRAGNGRVMAARALGWTHVAALVVDESAIDATAFAIADNRTSDLAEWDDGTLARLLESLPSDLKEAAGYDDKDMKELLASLGGDVVEDEAPEPLPDPVSRRGDLWVMGGHRILCGDSTDGGDVALVMNGEKAALCFTSPPYADAREYGGADVEVSTIASFLPAWANHCALLAVNLGIIRRDGAVVRYWDQYIEAAESAGLKLLSWNIWDRQQPWSMAQNTAMFPIEHEWVFVFGVKAKNLNLTVENKTPGTRTGITNRQADGSLERASPKEVRTHRPLGTIFRAPPHIGRDIGHPAMFPASLPSAYIEACTSNREVVGDAFGGSGTTIIAAEQLGRRCFAIEIEPRYVDVAVRRWQKLTGKDATHADTGKTWAETAAERGVKTE